MLKKLKSFLNKHSIKRYRFWYDVWQKRNTEIFENSVWFDTEDINWVSLLSLPYLFSYSLIHYLNRAEFWGGKELKSQGIRRAKHLCWFTTRALFSNRCLQFTAFITQVVKSKWKQHQGGKSYLNGMHAFLRKKYSTMPHITYIPIAKSN